MSLSFSYLEWGIAQWYKLSLTCWFTIDPHPWAHWVISYSNRGCVIDIIRPVVCTILYMEYCMYKRSLAALDMVTRSRRWHGKNRFCLKYLFGANDMSITTYLLQTNLSLFSVHSRTYYLSGHCHIQRQVIAVIPNSCFLPAAGSLTGTPVLLCHISTTTCGPCFTVTVWRNSTAMMSACTERCVIFSLTTNWWSSTMQCCQPSSSPSSL